MWETSPGPCVAACLIRRRVPLGAGVGGRSAYESPHLGPCPWRWHRVACGWVGLGAGWLPRAGGRAGGWAGGGVWEGRRLQQKKTGILTWALVCGGRGGGEKSGGKKNKKNYSTWTSRVVTHRTTIQARTCLTSQIGRDAVLSRLYGRRWSGDACKQFEVIGRTHLSSRPRSWGGRCSQPRGACVGGRAVGHGVILTQALVCVNALSERGSGGGVVVARSCSDPLLRSVCTAPMNQNSIDRSIDQSISSRGKRRANALPLANGLSRSIDRDRSTDQATKSR